MQKIFLFLLLISTSMLSNELALLESLQALQVCYPDHITQVDEQKITWTDGTVMPVGELDPAKSVVEKLNNPCLADQLIQPLYYTGQQITEPYDDPGRIRYEPFFRKMYGNSADEVAQHLVEVPWMPHIFGNKTKILLVTTINGINQKISNISDELELLVVEHPEYIKFLTRPGGTFCWRNIANTNRLSNHSFGMTIDINARESQYWQWDLREHAIPVHEEAPLIYRNTIPFEIVVIFEKYGFIWGGKWYHYDTMHFEYRPELMV